MEFYNSPSLVLAQLNGVDFVAGPIGITNLNNYALHAIYTKYTAVNKNFATTDVSIANDTVTITGHGYATGLKVTLTTTTTLPAGLATSTTYYLIKVDANTIAFATSQANAVAGTKIDITDQGTGTHTVVPNTTLAATIDVQASNDYNPITNNAGNWIAILVGGSAVLQTISATGQYMWNISAAGYRWVRLNFVITSGQMTTTVTAHAKE